jgi:hypothetical protein
MQLKRIIGSATAVVAIAAAVVLYTVHPVKSSDHQDTYNLANAVGHNPSADITDVFVFPAPDNPANVVFAMDTYPLIAPGTGTSKFFDPTILWQFKISHQASGQEDEVIQFTANNVNRPGQQIAVYGPAKPNEVGTTNTQVAQTGIMSYNTPTTLSNGVQAFAGPRADPFVFDLFAFFSFLGDRNFQTHTSQSDPGAGDSLPNVNGDLVGVAQQLSPPYDQYASRVNTPTFNGFANGTMSSATNGYACSNNKPTNVLGGFNVLSFVVEVPKALLTNGFTGTKLTVWATSSSNATSN